MLFCVGSCPWEFCYYLWLLLEHLWYNYALRAENPSGDSSRQRLQPGPPNWEGTIEKLPPYLMEISLIESYESCQH